MRRPPPSPAAAGPPKAAAWLVHAFTASGAVLGMLALMAVLERRWDMALVWLLVALVVDGVDGSLARWARTKEQAPRIDGDTLDLIIDYLNYVFIPAVLIWRAGLVSEALAPWLASLILISSLYCFTRSDLKSPDNYFRGFPALWNVVAFYLFVARPGDVAGAAIIVVLAALTFAPVYFVHPFRVRDFGRWPPVLATAWTIATAALLWPGWSEGVRTLLLWLSGGTAAVLIGMGFVRTFRGPRDMGEVT